MLPTGMFDTLAAFTRCRVLAGAFRQLRWRLKDYKPCIESLSILKMGATNQ